MTEHDPMNSGLINEDAFTATVVLEDADEAAKADQAEPSEAMQADVTAEAPRWAGKRLGRFKLLRLLGEGGMGVVIQAQDIHLGRIVALKVLRRQIKGVDDQQRVSQFLREAKSAARIQHPNAAQVYEINEHKGWWYIASEMIEGGTLTQVVKAAGKLSPVQACPLIADAASVLAAAHQAGIIHRDIKPHNLMLTRMGRCKVVDFGLVRVEDPNDPFDFTKQAVGTPQYLPPEAVKRGRPTPAYDVYALAATLYYALTGELPFKAKSTTKMASLHAKAPRPDARDLNPDCSPRLAELIQQGMAVDPDERPTAADFAAALRVENIGSDYDPATLVQSAKAAHPGDPNASASGISALPLSGTQPQSTGALASHDSTQLGVHTAQREQRKTKRTAAIVAAAAVVVALVGYVVVQQFGGPATTSDAEAFAQRFPNAPAAYGTRAPGTAPPAVATLDAPSFSWVGQREPGNNAYVASTDGNSAYPIDHPAALLIRADLATFYETRADAERAGKTIIE